MATKKPMYGYTIADDVDTNLPDQSGEKFDTEKMRKGQAQLVQTPFADRKAMRYLGNEEEPNFEVTRAGAGRGKKGGPTAKELAMKKGGMTASRRADGIAQRGKTRGTIVMCGGGMYKK